MERPASADGKLLTFDRVVRCFVSELEAQVPTLNLPPCPSPLCNHVGGCDNYDLFVGYPKY